jgi:demethylmenaquinone methyltransferase/2-methoxy-6-polyprenyl-1,4-benzoquinol methylase
MSSPAASGADGVAETSHGSARKRHALELFRELPARYDELSAALSFWQDPRWRRALVEEIAPRDGERILDVACGTGLVTAELRSRARCSVIALDQSEQMLARARERFRDEVQIVRGEAESLPFPSGSFDALTFTYLLRYVEDPRATVAELARVVRPGGRMAMLEFGVPPWAPARAAWRLYTRAGLPLLGGIFGRQWREVGRFLGPSIDGFYKAHPLAAITGYWREAGLRDVRVRRMSLGGGVVLSAVREAGRQSGAR